MQYCYVYLVNRPYERQGLGPIYPFRLQMLYKCSLHLLFGLPMYLLPSELCAFIYQCKSLLMQYTLSYISPITRFRPRSANMEGHQNIHLPLFITSSLEP